MAAAITYRQGVPSLKKLGDLSKEICDCWVFLGLQLGVDETAIESIRIDHVQYPSAQSKAYAVLKKWHDKGRASTYCMLAGALIHENKNGLAERYCEASDAGARLHVNVRGHSGVQRDGTILQAMSVEEIMRTIVTGYLQASPPQNIEDYHNLLAYLETFRLNIGPVEMSSLRITVGCTSLEILEDLWQDYISGALNEAAEKYLVTDEVLKKYNLKHFKLVTIIDDEEYGRCKEELTRMEGIQDNPSASKQETRPKTTFWGSLANRLKGLVFQIPPCDAPAPEVTQSEVHVTLPTLSIHRMTTRDYSSESLSWVRCSTTTTTTTSTTTTTTTTNVPSEPHVPSDSSLDVKIDTSFHDVAKKGQTGTVLGLEGDVNAQNEYRTTLLHLAAQLRRTGNRFMLMSKGIDVDARDELDKTSLHYAAERGDTVSVSVLVGNGSDVNARDKWDKTPLHYATERGGTKSVSVLVGNGSDVNARDKWDKTPLHYAAERGDTESVSLLVGKASDVNPRDKSDMTPLHYAAQRGNTESLSVLVHGKACDMNAGDKMYKTPLHYAAERGDAESVSVLVGKGSDVNARNIIGKIPLHYAAERRNIESVSGLVNKGSDVNSRDESKNTPLLYAVKRGNTESVSVLVNEGSDVNVRDEWDKTPLHYAAERGDTESVSVLVNNGSDVNARDEWDKTPLHYAAKRGDTESVSVLIHKGSDVNARDRRDRIPLHYAHANRRTDVISILISQRSDVSICDEGGRIPSLLAEMKLMNF